MSPCLIGPADRRLRDAFHIWRKMEAAYFEPEEFRRQLNAFFQETRNVTFILQKNKKGIPNFDAWYARWQERFRNDPLLKWSVASRNRITKQGDLDTRSLNFVTFITDWTDEMTRRFSAQPAVPSTVLVRKVLEKIPPELISEESLLCIERRWEDRELPDRELLDATSYVLLRLFELVQDAHEFIGKQVLAKPCEQFEKLKAVRQSYPFNLANADDSRKLWIRATGLDRIKYDLAQQVIFDRQNMSDVKKELEQRYGRVPKSLERDNSETLNDAVASNLATAKWLLAKDKNLASFVFAMPTDGKSMIVMQLQMEDRAGKHIAIRRVASFLSRHQIKWAMLVGESWIASFDPDKPLPSRHAIDYPNRREAITVQGVSVDGSFSNRYVEFSRRGDKIIFGEEKADYHPSNILLPILKAMKKPND